MGTGEEVIRGISVAVCVWGWEGGSEVTGVDQFRAWTENMGGRDRRCPLST